VDVSSDGYSFDESMDYDEQNVSPYVGLVYRITPTVNAYASYSDIFEPQSEIGADLEPLGAAQGTSYEAGLRADMLERRLLASLAVFYARQDDYAEYAGFDAESGLSYYKGVDVTSQGIEFEVSGAITDQWLLTAGYTDLSLKDPDGAPARTFVPRRTFNLTSRYEPLPAPGLRLGAAVKWQDDIYLDTDAGTIRQDGRAVWSAFLGYEIGRHWELALSGDNLTDEKYLASLYWDQAFYAPPRNWSASVNLTF
jgi:outer membrane receptor for ferric coprogen and ferric-rhodotorulic acid